MIQTSLIAKFIEFLLESADSLKKGVKNKLEPIKDNSNVLSLITVALLAILAAIKEIFNKITSDTDSLSDALSEGSYADVALGKQATVVSKFGSDRSWNRTPEQRARGNTKHMGTDYQASYGTPLYAPFDGTVIFAKTTNNGSAGRYVRFLSEDKTTTVTYMHLSSLSVKKGDKVSKGQLIGKSGGSGHGKDRAYSPHLHLEVKKGGKYVDPESIKSTSSPQSVNLSQSQIKVLSTTGVSDSKIKEAFKYLSAKLSNSMSAEGLSGLLGNFIAESGLNPGSYNREKGNYGAQGIAQWRGSRVKNFINKFGKQPRYCSLTAQLDFVAIELLSTYKSAFNKLARASSPENAADLALGYYEFSSGYSKAVSLLGSGARVSVRRSSARRVYSLCKDLMGKHRSSSSSSVSVRTHSKHTTV